MTPAQLVARPPSTVVLPAVTVDDLTRLARTLWGEARGEGVDGMTAVACVIRNRVFADLGDDLRPDWWGEGYGGVVSRPKQFSCWNADDPNRATIETVTVDDPSFTAAVDVAYRTILWRVADPTGGSTHYVARSILTKLPEHHWARVAVPRFSFGRHVFFKLA